MISSSFPLSDSKEQERPFVFSFTSRNTVYAGISRRQSCRSRVLIHRIQKDCDNVVIGLGRAICAPLTIRQLSRRRWSTDEKSGSSASTRFMTWGAAARRLTLNGSHFTGDGTHRGGSSVYCLERSGISGRSVSRQRRLWLLQPARVHRSCHILWTDKVEKPRLSFTRAYKTRFGLEHIKAEA
jgi:hypothetical protein